MIKLREFMNSTLEEVGSSLEFFETFKSGLKLQSPDNESFKESQKKEMYDLVERGLFKIDEEHEYEVFRVYGGRFVNEIKNEGHPTLLKSQDLLFKHLSTTITT